MNCQHIDEGSSAEAVHTLPCRDTLCMPCVYGISDLFKGNPFSCPLCGNYTQYVDAMIQSIKDEANTHRTKQMGQKKEEFTTSRIGEHMKGDQRSDEASEWSDRYNKLTKGDPPGVHASDKSFATSYSPGGHSCNFPPQSTSISASQQHHRQTYRDHHGWSRHPNLPAVTGTRAHHHQEELLARCQQNKANAERDFHLNNGRDIPDNYCQSDEGQGTSKADVFCIEHNQSEVYFFCLTCSRPVCGKCVNSTHSKHEYFNFDSPGETDSEKQSKCYPASLSDASAGLSPSKFNRSSDCCQGFRKCSKDEDYPLNMEGMDRHQQREPSEQYEQAKHPTHYSERDFHLDNRMDICDSYYQSDKGQGTSKADVFCIEHDLSEVYFFCETCSRPVCGKCVNSTHSKHKYFNFDSPGETDSEKQSKHEQRELSEQYEQAKHPTNYDTHVSPQTHQYNLRSRSTGARRYSETEVAQVDTVGCKGKGFTEEHCDHKYDKFDISEYEKTHEVICAAHNLPCDMYCVRCNVMICLNCTKEIKHHWYHKTWSLDKETVTDKVMECIKTLEESTEDCDKLKESSAKGKEKIQKEADELKEKVRKATQLAKEKIDAIAAEQIAKIADELDRCMKPRKDFDVEIANMEKELKGNKETIDTALQLITDNDLPNAALAARSVNDSLQKITKTNLRISQPSGRLGLVFQVNDIPRAKHNAPLFVYRPSYSDYPYFRSTYP